MKDKVKIINDDGSTVEYDVLFSFDVEGKNYVVYTDYKKDEEGNIITTSAEYINDTFKPITDEKALSLVDELISYYNKEKRDN